MRLGLRKLLFNTVWVNPSNPGVSTQRLFRLSLWPVGRLIQRRISSHFITNEQVKARLGNVRKEYKEWKTVSEFSGIGWDPEHHVFTASPAVWAARSGCCPPKAIQIPASRDFVA